MGGRGVEKGGKSGGKGKSGKGGGEKGDRKGSGKGKGGKEGKNKENKEWGDGYKGNRGNQKGGSNEIAQASEAWSEWENGGSKAASKWVDSWRATEEGFSEGQVPVVPTRRRASQLRWAHRVLRRHAPEERIYDAAQQLGPGDHILTHKWWDASDRHGIVLNTGGRSRGDSTWVIYWDKDHLQSASLGQFAEGGDLYRVPYPHWACRCLQPSASTMAPQVLAEQRVEAVSEDVVVRVANSAYKSGKWRPSWSSEAADLEFCMFAKTGGGDGSQMPSWELSGRTALASSSGKGGLADRPIGVQIRGAMPPSEVLSAVGCGVSTVAAHPSLHMQEQQSVYPGFGQLQAQQAGSRLGQRHPQLEVEQQYQWGGAQVFMPGMSSFGMAMQGGFPGDSAYPPQHAPGPSDWGTSYQ